LISRADNAQAHPIDTDIVHTNFIYSTLMSPAIGRIAVEIGGADLTGLALYMGAIKRNAFSIPADLTRPAANFSRSTVRRQTLAVGTSLAGRALQADTVLPDAAALETNLPGFANLFAAGNLKTLAPRTALPDRAVHAYAIYMNAAALVAYFAEVRAFEIGAVDRVTPAVGTQPAGLAFNTNAGASLADIVDADLAFAKAFTADAVGRVAVAPGTTFIFRAVDFNATALNALLVDTNFGITRTLFGFTVDRIADTSGTALIETAIDIDTTDLLTFFVNTYFTQARTSSPDAVF